MLGREGYTRDNFRGDNIREQKNLKIHNKSSKIDNILYIANILFFSLTLFVHMWQPENESLKLLVDLLNESQVPDNTKQHEIHEVFLSTPHPFLTCLENY